MKMEGDTLSKSVFDERLYGLCLTILWFFYVVYSDLKPIGLHDGIYDYITYLSIVPIAGFTLLGFKIVALVKQEILKQIPVRYTKNINVISFVFVSISTNFGFAFYIILISLIGPTNDLYFLLGLIIMPLSYVFIAIILGFVFGVFGYLLFRLLDFILTSIHKKTRLGFN